MLAPYQPGANPECGESTMASIEDTLAVESSDIIDSLSEGVYATCCQ